VRVEQLYPAPSEQIAAELAKYPNAKAAWVQDEPANQGPWPFFGLYVAPQLEQKITLVSRPASAATSAGNAKRHDAENAVLLQQAFAR